MKRDILVVRGNINDTIVRLEQLAKEKEERERVEREARWAKEREEREAKEAAWKKEHFILDKYTYMSQWNWETYSWVGDYINLFFYEWSDINSEPRHFPHTTAFYRFLDSSKLNLTDEINEKFKHVPGCHMTCVPGTHDLIIGITYQDLKRQYEEKTSLANILKDVPSVGRV